MSNPQQKHQQNPVIQLFEMATGFMQSQAIYVAAKLGLADLLQAGPKNITDLAQATGTNQPALYRLLRALTSIGVFAENGDGNFELTPLSAALLNDIPMSLRHYVLLMGDPTWWNAWGALLYSVKTGEPAFDRLFGMGYTEYLAQHPDLSETLNACMTSVSQVNNPAIVQSYDFSGFKKIIDLGGGHGSLLTAILKANPEASGVLFDLPHVIQTAKLDAAIASRCEMVGGDFFKVVPPGGDAYLLKQIIHDWEDARCRQILKNCHQVMPENSRLLVIEAVIAPGEAQSINKFFDLHLLVTAQGGKERDEAEFRALFEAAGFTLSRIIPTPSSFCIIEGVR